MAVAKLWTSSRAVSLVHVRYHHDDLIGYVLAWASLLPIFIGLGGFISHFIFRRELQAFFFALGIAVSEILNLIIKDWVKQDRPTTCALLEMCDSHGWPSSHSQFMCFFSTYMMLLALRRFSFSDMYSKLFTAFVSWPFTLLTMYSRIYLGYHSLEQVIAGGTAGIIFGAGWFYVVQRKIAHYFPRLQTWGICRYLLIKDSSHIRNVLLFEYTNSLKAQGHLQQRGPRGREDNLEQSELKIK
eukprot:TRINITY_DN24304_c0_g1_i1.p1 TRINITY_DN24304_c0_g1~~TRINITY_DN24304_c0_g1_i1.p1  ORF type:complete len:267 (-),score=15.15 TRINITY_DN24304_c0_g1_i1:481-1206(-)